LEEDLLARVNEGFVLVEDFYALSKEGEDAQYAVVLPFLDEL